MMDEWIVKDKRRLGWVNMMMNDEQTYKDDAIYDAMMMIIMNKKLIEESKI